MQTILWPVLLLSSLTLAPGLAACGDDGGGFALGGLGAIEIEPAALEVSMGLALAGGEVHHELRVTNSGTARLEIDDIRVEPADAATAALPMALRLEHAELPIGVAPSASRPLIDVVYTRVDDTPRAYRIVIDSDDRMRPTVIVPVDVVAGASHLVVYPGSLAFELAAEPATQRVRLLNTGTADLRVTRLRLAAPADFAAAFEGTAIAAQADVVLSPPVVVPPASERAVDVTFTPRGSERVSGDLIVYADDPSATGGLAVPLVGNEGGPCLLVHPGDLPFGTNAPGDVVELPVTIESCGTRPVDVTGVRLATAADAADPTLAGLGVSAATSARFELAQGLGHLPLTLAPGATASLSLRYRAWTEAELGDVPGLYQDVGALVVTSTAWRPVAVVTARAATELEAPPDDPIVPDVPGCEWEGGAVTRHHVAVTLTADNYYELWVNGTLMASDTGHWANEDVIELDLDSGCHVIGVHAWGDGAVTAGMIAAVEIDGVIRWTTGDAKPEWSVTGPDAPAGDWHALGFDDSAWADPRACTTTSQWGAAVDPMLLLGAHWVWWNPECDDQLATAWFRLTFTVD